MRRSTNGGASSAGPSDRQAGQWKNNPDPGDLLPPKNAPVASLDLGAARVVPIDNSLDYIVQNNSTARTFGADICSRGHSIQEPCVEHDHR